MNEKKILSSINPVFAQSNVLHVSVIEIRAQWVLGGTISQ